MNEKVIKLIEQIIRLDNINKCLEIDHSYNVLIVQFIITAITIIKVFKQKV